MKFSNKTNWPTGLNPFSKKIEALKAEGFQLLDLTVSNTTQAGFGYLTEDILTALQNKTNLCYTPEPRGLPSARESICDYYASKGVEIGPDQIFITANTSEAYSYLFKLLTNAGDKILTPTPSYPLLNYLTDLHELETIPYRISYHSGWSVDKTSLKVDEDQNLRALLTVHPNNPTGNYVTDEERNELYRVCEKYSIPLIADEVFFDFPLDPEGPGGLQTVATFAGNKEVLTFTLSGISKVLGLPQMKLSWIVASGPEKDRTEAIRRLEIIADTYISASTPIQNALPDWFKKIGLIQHEILARIRQNYEQLREFAKSQKRIDVLKSDSGWNVIIKLPSNKTDEEWCLYLLDHAKVLTHPGYLFDLHDESYLVLSLLVSTEIFKQGLIQVFTVLGSSDSILT